jgi:hypothetical protein
MPASSIKRPSEIYSKWDFFWFENLATLIGNLTPALQRLKKNVCFELKSGANEKSCFLSNEFPICTSETNKDKVVYCGKLFYYL